MKKSISYLCIMSIISIRKTVFELTKKDINFNTKKFPLYIVSLFFVCFFLSTFIFIIINLFIKGLGGNIPSYFLVLFAFFIGYMIIKTDLKICVKNFWHSNDEWIYLNLSKKQNFLLTSFRGLNTSLLKIIIIYPSILLGIMISTLTLNQYGFYTNLLILILIIISLYFSFMGRLLLTFTYSKKNDKGSYLRLLMTPIFILLVFIIIKMKVYLHFNIDNIQKININSIIPSLIIIGLVLSFIITYMCVKSYGRLSSKILNNNLKTTCKFNNRFSGDSIFSFLQKEKITFIRLFELKAINTNYLIHSFLLFMSVIIFNKILPVVNGSSAMYIFLLIYVVLSSIIILFVLDKYINIENEGNFILIFPKQLHSKLMLSKVLSSIIPSLFFVNLLSLITITLYFETILSSLTILIVASLITLILNLTYHIPFLLFPMFDWGDESSIGNSSKGNMFSIFLNGLVFSAIFTIISFHFVILAANRISIYLVCFYTISTLLLILVILIIVLISTLKFRRYKFGK